MRDVFPIEVPGQPAPLLRAAQADASVHPRPEPEPGILELREGPAFPPTLALHAPSHAFGTQCVVAARAEQGGVAGGPRVEADLESLGAAQRGGGGGGGKVGLGNGHPGRRRPPRGRLQHDLGHLQAVEVVGCQPADIQAGGLARESRPRQRHVPRADIGQNAPPDGQLDGGDPGLQTVRLPQAHPLRHGRHAGQEGNGHLLHRRRLAAGSPCGNTAEEEPEGEVGDAGGLVGHGHARVFPRLGVVGPQG